MEAGYPKETFLLAARIAGIQGAKKKRLTWIPLCHPLMLTKVSVDINTISDCDRCYATCSLAGKTGVEMEAYGASIAALTLFDMCKRLIKGHCDSSMCHCLKRRVVKVAIE